MVSPHLLLSIGSETSRETTRNETAFIIGRLTQTKVELIWHLSHQCYNEMPLNVLSLLEDLL